MRVHNIPKSIAIYHVFRILPCLICALGFWNSSPSAYATPLIVDRLENEVMLHVPEGKAEEVWAWLKATFRPQVQLANEQFSTIRSIEEFDDQYFDTPDLRLASQWAGLRLRFRVGEGGSDKSLIQLKATPKESKNTLDLVRAERKFFPRLEHPNDWVSGDNSEPLHLVRLEDRDRMRADLGEIGVDVDNLTRWMRIRQERRRVYFRQGDKQFFTITLDLTRAKYLIFPVSFAQIELEIGENAFTQADEARRAHFTEAQKALRAMVDARFPGLVQDQRPKVVRALDAMQERFFIVKPLWTILHYDWILILGIIVLMALAITARLRSSRLKP